jgi:hypothetical protein
MTTHVDDVLKQISCSEELLKFIEKSSKLNKRCDNTSTVISEHAQCFESNAGSEHSVKWIACPRAVLYLIINLIASKPTLLDDDSKKLLSDYLKQQDVKVSGLVTENILKLLNSKNANSQTMTWLKYEILLKQLISDYVYEPKTLSNEIIAHVKKDLDPSLAIKFSSALKSCVDICRKINNKHVPDEEEEEKWCEIIDWMSWLMSGNDADMD